MFDSTAGNEARSSSGSERPSRADDANDAALARSESHAWVARAVASAIAERLSTPASAIDENDLLVEQLGLRPLDLVLIVAGMEGIDAVPFPAHALASARTVDELVDVLHAALFGR